jgi:uncharacterized protein (TIGR03032 family)
MTDSHEITQNESIKISVSNSFQDWVSKTGGTLLVTSISGKLIMISAPGGRTQVFMRELTRPTGLVVDGDRLIVSTHHQTILFVNSARLAAGYPPDAADAEKGRYDAIYLPQKVYITGRINTHDIGAGSDALWLVNTSYCCLCTLSEDCSFIPRWKPPFVSLITPEDRCHLNGLAIRDGQPRYVTALSETDTINGWRPTINESGCLMEVPSGEFVLRNLAMPHSPRWHNGRLWFLNSAAGEFCVADMERGKYDVICCLPGMTRGMWLMGDYAIIGLSLLRAKEYESRPRQPVQDRFDKLICGVAIVDLRNGKPIGLLQFTSGIGELYDINFVPGVQRPIILSLDQDEEVARAVTVPQFGWWLPRSDKEEERRKHEMEAALAAAARG